MAAKFVVYHDKSKKFRFRLIATNGEIIAVGEAYESKASCLKGIKSIQKNAPVAAIIDETEKKEAAKKEAPKKEVAKKEVPKKEVAKKEDAKKAPAKKAPAKKPESSEVPK